MKSQYLATLSFFLERYHHKMSGFSLPVKVDVQFERACRHIIVNFKNLTSVPTGVCTVPKCISFQTLLSFPYASINMVQLTNNCLACYCSRNHNKDKWQGNFLAPWVFFPFQSESHNFSWPDNWEPLYEITRHNCKTNKRTSSHMALLGILAP